MKLAIIGCLSMLALTCNCFGPSAAKVYGRASNPDRLARRLPAIPDRWSEDRQGAFCVWHNPAFSDPQTTNAPMHEHKELCVDRSGRPLEETDYYLSGKWSIPLRCWRDPDDPQKKEEERLIVRYDFEAARTGKDPWHCDVNAGPHAREQSLGVVSFQQAEEILKEWGVSRL